MDKREMDKEAQRQRFIETARQLECDEDKERFKKKLDKIAKPKAKLKKGARTEVSGV